MQEGSMMHIQFAELPMFDQERAKAFYIDHLNCRVVADRPMSNDGWRWIELGCPGVEIVTEPRPAPWRPGCAIAEFRDSEGNRMMIVSR
jgi:predicted enzyme related to lactoylglutathione lyase